MYEFASYVFSEIQQKVGFQYPEHLKQHENFIWKVLMVEKDC